MRRFGGCTKRKAGAGSLDKAGAGGYNRDKREGDSEGENGILKLSSKFINPNDQLFRNADKIKPLEGYDDIVCHGSPEGLLIYGLHGEEWSYNAKEAAEIIRNSKEFTGKSVRLISCQTGAGGDQSFAQKIADELGVEVMAPTEIVTVDPINGEMFVSDNDVLALLWTKGENVTESGEWVIFKPKGGGSL